MKHNLPIALALCDSPPPYLKGVEIIENSQKWGQDFLLKIGGVLHIGGYLAVKGQGRRILPLRGLGYLSNHRRKGSRFLLALLFINNIWIL